METGVKDFIAKEVSPEMAERYAGFCDWINNDEEFVPQLTDGVFANLTLKKTMAKRMVRKLLHGSECHDALPADELVMYGMDARLRALTKYYLTVEVLGNKELTDQQLYEALLCFRGLRCSNATWLKGRSLIDESGDAIVHMRPGDPLYAGYRFFVVNMLCFTADKFVLGFRSDNGPVRHPMKYYKGCRPMGRRTSADGTEWNAIMFDRALSDDHFAVFSNQLDGEGTVEVCDWLSEREQRVVFRRDY